MTRALISVCLTTYNQKLYIRECLDSVLSQVCDAELEILVGDDCSDDGTSQIVGDMAIRNPRLIRHVRHETRRGASENTKALLRECRGQFIARLDGDDYWLPGKLKRQMAYLNTDHECAAVYTNALTIDETGKPIGIFNDVGDEDFDLTAMVRRGNFLNNSSVLFRRQSIQPWLEITTPSIDYRAHLVHASFGHLAQIAEPLTAYRVNAQGSMVAGMNSRVRELYWEAIQSVPRDKINSSDLARGMADFLRRVAFRAVATRQWSLFQHWVTRVFAASPAGRLRMTLLTTASISRILGKEIAGVLRRDRDGHRIVVLFRR